MTSLRELLAELTVPDESARGAAAARAAAALRPPGALARLDELAAWLAGWQGRSAPRAERVAALIFAADHGVVEDGVSAYPASVTASMVAAFHAGAASINAMARVAGAEVHAVDVGVGRPSANLARAPALSEARFAEAVDAGVAAVERLGPRDLVIVGEMGIGNTTAAAAVCACILGGPPQQWVGRGAGADDAALAAKAAAVAAAQARTAAERDPLELLRQVGGAELAAIAGAVAQARRRRLPVLLDGYVTAAAVLPLHAARSGALEHCAAGHVSAEPGHGLVLGHLGLRPLLDLGLRLGEGSGAMAAAPLAAMACALVNEVPTFAEWFGA